MNGKEGKERRMKKLDKRQMKKKIAKLWVVESHHLPIDWSKVTITQRNHPKTGWDGHGISPLPFSIESLAHLESRGYTWVSLTILDTEGFYVTRCADFRIDEFKTEGEPTWAELKAGRLTLPCSRCCANLCSHYDDDHQIETAGRCKKCYPGIDDAVLIVTGFYYNGKGLCDGHAECVYDEFYGNLEAKGIKQLPCRIIK